MAAPRKALVISGWVITVVVVAMLCSSAVMKLSGSPEIAQEMGARLGYPESSIKPIGITELICALLYAIPQTAVLGAILLTGYLGGAVATHVRVGDPFMNGAFGPIFGGVLVWLGLYLRDRRIRELAPLRQPDRESFAN